MNQRIARTHQSVAEDASLRVASARRASLRRDDARRARRARPRAELARALDAKRDAERVRRLDVARRADARRDARAHRAVLVVLPRDVARGGDAVERRASAARVRGVRGTDAGVRAVRDVSSDGEKRRRMGRRRVPGVRERGDEK